MYSCSKWEDFGEEVIDSKKGKAQSIYLRSHDLQHVGLMDDRLCFALILVNMLAHLERCDLLHARPDPSSFFSNLSQWVKKKTSTQSSN